MVRAILIMIATLCWTAACKENLPNDHAAGPRKANVLEWVEKQRTGIDEASFSRQFEGSVLADQAVRLIRTAAEPMPVERFERLVCLMLFDGDCSAHGTSSLVLSDLARLGAGALRTILDLELTRRASWLHFPLERVHEACIQGEVSDLEGLSAVWISCFRREGHSASVAAKLIAASVFKRSRGSATRSETVLSAIKRIVSVVTLTVAELHWLDELAYTLAAHQSFSQVEASLREVSRHLRAEIQATSRWEARELRSQVLSLARFDDTQGVVGVMAYLRAPLRCSSKRAVWLRVLFLFDQTGSSESSAAEFNAATSEQSLEDYARLLDLRATWDQQGGLLPMPRMPESVGIQVDLDPDSSSDRRPASLLRHNVSFDPIIRYWEVAGWRLVSVEPLVGR